MPETFHRWSNAEIVARRGERELLDPQKAYLYFNEVETNRHGHPVNVATVFLTNRECPFKCLMCDLWKNTLTESVRPGDIPVQISNALKQLPAARDIKLYNSGNFFDTKAIPRSDYPAIASLVKTFDTVIVENHPNLCDEKCLEFRDLIAPAQLEIAMGLETCNPKILSTLNKQMTLADFINAAQFLHDNKINIRAFLLLKPPFLDETEAVEWTLKSLMFAFNQGVQCCSIIPVRAGNGIMDDLEQDGLFSPPRAESIESVFEAGLNMQRGRVFIDTWDVGRFFRCDNCRNRRVSRLEKMNLQQEVVPRKHCTVCGS